MSHGGDKRPVFRATGNLSFDNELCHKTPPSLPQSLSSPRISPPQINSPGDAWHRITYPWERRRGGGKCHLFSWAVYMERGERIVGKESEARNVEWGSGRKSSPAPGVLRFNVFYALPHELLIKALGANERLASGRLTTTPKVSDWGSLSPGPSHTTSRMLPLVQQVTASNPEKPLFKDDFFFF